MVFLVTVQEIGLGYMRNLRFGKILVPIPLNYLRIFNDAVWLSRRARVATRCARIVHTVLDEPSSDAISRRLNWRWQLPGNRIGRPMSEVY